MIHMPPFKPQPPKAWEVAFVLITSAIMIAIIKHMLDLLPK